MIGIRIDILVDILITMLMSMPQLIRIGILLSVINSIRKRIISFFYCIKKLCLAICIQRKRNISLSLVKMTRLFFAQTRSGTNLHLGLGMFYHNGIH